MKNRGTLRKPILFIVLLVVFSGYYSCSGDDEPAGGTGTPNPEVRPAGTIAVDEQEWLVNNSIFVDVTVGQPSWLVAVEVENEATHEFIAQPVKIEQGTHKDVELTFDEGAIPNVEGGHEVILKLYADNSIRGTLGQWDESDLPITDAANKLVTELTTVFHTQESDAYTFPWYDIDKNGTLDFQEALETFNFPRYFREYWDPNNDDALNKQEFYHSFFLNSDFSLNNAISKEEWDAGFSALYSKWTDAEFSASDQDKNNQLTSGEWIDIFSESGWFEAYDTSENALISYEEWQAGLFADWDVNDDSLIDEEEFNSYIYFIFSWWRW